MVASGGAWNVKIIESFLPIPWFSFRIDLYVHHLSAAFYSSKMGEV